MYIKEVWQFYTAHKVQNQLNLIQTFINHRTAQTKMVSTFQTSYFETSYDSQDRKRSTQFQWRFKTSFFNSSGVSGSQGVEAKAKATIFVLEQSSRSRTVSHHSWNYVIEGIRYPLSVRFQIVDIIRTHKSKNANDYSLPNGPYFLEKCSHNNNT